MSAPAYSGGGDAGGKFRKRPFRQAPATPYDRPATAARAAVGGDSLRSRIVGTASRLIAGGATWILGSVLPKRLTAPPAAAAPLVAAVNNCITRSEENLQVRQEVSEVACSNPLPKLREQGHVGEASSDASSSDTDGISELEKLLKQKTFTRVEFNQLTELLRSRTIEPGTVEPTTNMEKKENEDNPAQDNGVEASILQENFLTLATTTTVARDELASPAELAKAYMGSIPSKVSPSSLSLRSQMFREDTTVTSLVPFVSKPVKRPPLPRSVAQYSAIPEFPEITYQTPKPPGRSAISPLFTSPYFKARPTTNTQGGDFTGDVYSGPSSSRLTPKNLAHSGGTQVLKRRSSVLDNDFDSFGPIRRIRQKYHLTPRSRNPPILSNKDLSRGSTLENPSQEELKHYNISLHEAEIKENKTFPPSVTPISSKSSETAKKILQHLDILASPPKDLNHFNTSFHEAENKLSPTSATPAPPKSSETGMKILQHLDILVSPSKEKSADPKTAAKDKSPSTSTGSVIGGKALKSMGESDPPTNSNGQGSSNTLMNSLSKKKYRFEANGPSQALFSGDKLMSESYGTVNTAVPPTAGNPGTSNVNIAIAGSAALPLRQSSAYCMSIPEDPLVSDHENHILGDVSGSLSTKSNDLKGKILKQNISTSETTSEKSPMASSSRPGSSDRKGYGGFDLSGKDTGFSFSVSSGLSTPSQLPSTPTMPGSSLDTSALQKEQTSTPTFDFGLKAAPISLVPSSMGSIGNGTAQEVNACDARMTTAKEGSSSGKTGEIPKDASSFKSFGSAVSSGITSTSSSGVFGFGSSSSSTTTTTTTTQSNGSLFSASLVSPLTAGPAVTSSDNRANSTFTTTTANTNGTSPVTSMSNPFNSTSAPISTVASFTFGARSAASTNTGNSSAALEPTSASPSTGSFFKFGASAQPTTSSSSQLGSTSPFAFGTPGPATSFGFPIFGGSVSSNACTTTSSVPAATTSLFNSSSQPFTSSAFGFTTGSSASSPSTGFAFGNSSSPFGSAVFSFTSSITTTSRASTPPVPVFGMPTSAGFGSESPGSQMNVEHTTAAAPTASLFGQQTNSTTTTPFGGTSLSQFAAPQFPSTQGQPFQAGNLGFSPGGGFSQGTGNSDKAGRRIVRIKRDTRKSRK